MTMAWTHIGRALVELGVDLEHPDFKGTPGRIASYWATMVPLGDPLETATEILVSATFPSEYDQLILAQDIDANGICPHHMLPVEYTVHVGYIPNEKDKLVVGLSKLPRAVRTLAKQPILQESLTELIVRALEEALAPLGVGAIVIGKHSCMRARGVEVNAPVTTSVMHGVLREKPQARAEFLDLVKLSDGRIR